MEDEPKKEPEQTPANSGYQFGLQADPLAGSGGDSSVNPQTANTPSPVPTEVGAPRQETDQASLGALASSPAPPADIAVQTTTAAGPPTLVETTFNSQIQPATVSDAPSAAPPTTLSAASAALSAAPSAIAEGDEKFSVDEVIGYGWRSMIKYFWPLLGILTSNFLVTSVPTAAVMVMNYSASSGPMQSASMFISLFSILLNQAVALGTVNIWLKICEGDTISTRDVYSKFKRVWKFMAAVFLYWSMVILGYIFFIIPGVYLQLRFQFYSYFIVDSDAGPIQALKASYAITKGCFAELFFLSIINWFIGWVGWLILLIGVFPAQAIQNIALARTYRQLLKNTPESDLPKNMPPIPVIAEVSPNANL